MTQKVYEPDEKHPERYQQELGPDAAKGLNYGLVGPHPVALSAGRSICGNVLDFNRGRGLCGKAGSRKCALGGRRRLPRRPGPPGPQ